MGCTATVLYYDGGEVLLPASDVWARRPGDDAAPTRIGHHKDLAAAFADGDVDVLVVPRVPGAAPRTPDEAWWAAPPRGVFAGATSAARSKGQNHRIVLTAARKQELRGHLAGHAAHLESDAGHAERCTSRYLRDWYAYAETRGPDRMGAFAADRVAGGSVNDTEALLDDVDYLLVTYERRRRHRDKSAAMNYTPMVAELNPVTGGRPARHLAVADVSPHAIMRSLQRVQGVMSDDYIHRVDDYATSGRAGAGQVRTAVERSVHDAVPRELVRKVRGMFAAALSDGRFDAQFATVPMSARAAESPRAHLRVTIPVGGQRRHFVVVVEPVRRARQQVDAADAGGRRAAGPREVTFVNVVTIFEPVPAYGWDPEGLYREHRPDADPDAGAPTVGQRIIERVLADLG